MAKKNKPVRLCIDTVEDRQLVAGILFKNGYSVTPGKQFKVGSKKSYDYYIEVVDTTAKNKWQAIEYWAADYLGGK